MISTSDPSHYPEPSEGSAYRPKIVSVEEEEIRADEQKTIPVTEEQVTVDKQRVETGKVLISKQVHEEERSIEVTEAQEEIQVERVPINRYVASPPSVRHEGDTMIIPVVQEEIVVEKRLRLVEEVRITTLRKETKRPVQLTLRKEEVSVERKSNTNSDPKP